MRQGISSIIGLHWPNHVESDYFLLFFEQLRCSYDFLKHRLNQERAANKYVRRNPSHLNYYNSTLVDKSSFF